MRQDRLPYAEAVMRARDDIRLKYSMNGGKLTCLITVNYRHFKSHKKRSSPQQAAKNLR
jgi:hypothetical protein